MFKCFVYRTFVQLLYPLVLGFRYWFRYGFWQKFWHTYRRVFDLISGSRVIDPETQYWSRLPHGCNRPEAEDANVCCARDKVKNIPLISGGINCVVFGNPIQHRVCYYQVN